MIRIGPGGTAGLGYPEGLTYAKQLGLDALEVEFTYGVRMTNEQAKAVGEIAKGLGIRLSVHAPYYINLLSKESDKIVASKKRIIDTCERAHHLCAKSIVYHPGFYQGLAEEEAYQLIKKETQELQDSIKKQGWKTRLCPETTGKQTQFGSLQELLRLRKETGCGITIDFSHILARTNGQITFKEIMQQAPDEFHAHFSGIEYGDKGEKKHILTTKQFFTPLAEELIKKQKTLDITIINESPDPFNDAKMMKQMLNETPK